MISLGILGVLVPFYADKGQYLSGKNRTREQCWLRINPESIWPTFDPEARTDPKDHRIKRANTVRERLPPPSLPLWIGLRLDTFSEES